ncbi:MAG TPA: hypothetical protein VKE74_19375 [Gemmataceae bacterium]|nr:hypothetical protein [Gemmataceae bacterium]
MIRWWHGPGLVLCVCLLAGGCSSANKAEKKVQVSGKVNIDGKPLPDGDITFTGEPGTIPDSLPVKNGTFEGTVKLGRKKVEIRAYKTEKAPPTATGGVTETQVNYIPDRYNTRSTLSAEVTENGVNPSTFDVQAR